ncbi:hypothetical protein A9Q99_18675 [Gammaproteobacteria bacterium 45_16_T64]|nr:hypothetical protein A9Q99_18675 [Gammaproteobacteria bacterium 45_16_T64]
MNIAKACLSAINQTNTQSTDLAYQEVFDAIDTAFTEQFGLLGSDHQKMRDALDTIANLPEDELSQAPQIARLALKKPH